MRPPSVAEQSTERHINELQLRGGWIARSARLSSGSYPVVQTPEVARSGSCSARNLHRTNCNVEAIRLLLAVTGGTHHLPLFMSAGSPVLAKCLLAEAEDLG